MIVREISFLEIRNSRQCKSKVTPVIHRYRHIQTLHPPLPPGEVRWMIDFNNNTTNPSNRFLDPVRPHLIK